MTAKKKQEETVERSKYNVKKDKSDRTYDGIVFDSVLEMKYYRDVVLPKYKDGKIKYFELQKPYELQPKFKRNNKTVLPIKYVADFYIEYADGTIEVIDTKGFPDSVALMKHKMFWYKFPEINYKWLKYVEKFGGWIEYEEYMIKKRKEKREKKQKNNAR